MDQRSDLPLTSPSSLVEERKFEEVYNWSPRVRSPDRGYPSPPIDIDTPYSRILWSSERLFFSFSPQIWRDVRVSRNDVVCYRPETGTALADVRKNIEDARFEVSSAHFFSSFIRRVRMISVRWASVLIISIVFSIVPSGDAHRWEKIVRIFSPINAEIQ